MSDVSSPARPPIVVRDGLVLVSDLAEAIGLDRSNVLKSLKGQGIKIEKRRSAEARGQFVSAIDRADAERFIAVRRAETLGSRGEITYLETDRAGGGA
jgi:hypothetical protein